MKKYPSKKDKYNADYVQNESGKYVYTGVYYSFNLSSGKLKFLKIVYFLISLFMFALFAAGGFLNTPGSRIMYVILPYVLMFLPLAFILSDTVKIILSENRMTYKQYDRSVLQLKRACIALIAVSGIALAGEIIHLFTGGKSGILSLEVPFLIICITICCFSIVLLILQGKNPCISTEK